MLPTLGLSIPLYNEERLCVQVVEGLHETLSAARVPFTLALVNNGSQDKTPALINRLAIRYEACRAIHLEVNAGYGGGILAGLNALDTPLLGWTWGDGQVQPDATLRCYQRLLQEGLDLVKARRVQRLDGLDRALISRGYNLWMRAYGLRTSDTNGCPKLMRRALFERLQLRSLDWFLDPEVMLKATELGARIGEEDVIMHPRAGGESKVRWRTQLEFTRHLLAWRRGWRPGD